MRLLDRLTGKKNTYRMDPRMADATLQNVFASCNRQPNTISFDVLSLRLQNNAAPYTVGMILSGIVFFLVLVFPVVTLLLFRMTAGNTIVQTPQPVSGISLVSHHLDKDDIFYLEIAPGDDELDASCCVMYTMSDEEIAPLSFSSSLFRRNVVITFPYNGEEVNILIAGKKGGTLQLLLVPSP